MTERLLQYIWQFQHFNLNDLNTDEGEPVQVIHPGTHNTNQGPDFLDGKIRIKTMVWAGSIELHLNSSDWINHKHSHDKNYRNVILHVVWKNDITLNLPFPTLVLHDKVPKILLHKYDELMKTGSFIPCEKTIQRIDKLTWQSWKERLLVERLEKKTGVINTDLQQNNFHWAETFWWQLAKHFGAKLNTDAFENLARSVSVNILAKLKGQIHQTEALLFGQAGLLEATFTEAYPKLLQKEYRFLKKKYNLQRPACTVHFLRMRPSNFPTVRLAQLAMLVHKSKNLFSRIIEISDIRQIRELLHITANDYWHYHYVFDEETAFKKKSLGKQMIDTLIINTIVPILFTYGNYHNANAYREKALRWLEQLHAEKNTITTGFVNLKIENKTAFDSQALIQLKNAYCNTKKCLDCSVGYKLLRSL